MKRRDFIKKALATGVVATVAPTLAASAFPSVFLPPKITSTRYISLQFLSYPLGTRYWNTAFLFCGAFVLTTIMSAVRNSGNVRANIRSTFIEISRTACSVYQ